MYFKTLNIPKNNIYLTKFYEQSYFNINIATYNTAYVVEFLNIYII